MGGTEQTSVDGVGVLTYQRAIDIARNTEGDLDANVADYLESAVNHIQSNLDNYPDSALAPAQSRQYIRAATASLLEVFQVYPPVLTVIPDGTLEITDGSSTATVAIIDSHRKSCQQTLVSYSFAYSYGQPFVGNYTPPPCSFNRVTWNLTVKSRGRQFDRLGIVYLGDIEVFRTSTAEPTANGIEWTYLKDMTSYLSLFNRQEKIIFDLGNLIDSTYTGAFNTTLTASYFTATDSIEPADVILPVSANKGSSGGASVFTVPSDTASWDLTLPRNALKAIFTVAATGQSQEEFWWSNTLQSEINTFPEYGTLYGYSPFREVQVFIDGILAGVAWPFPIIFTGGVVPGLWRPVVGIDAFDLKEDEIDITPWLPLLCDGNAHNFTIRVSGLNDSGNGTATLSETTDSYWLITGKVFVWLDKPGHITTGTLPSKVQPAPSFQVSSSVGTVGNGTNSTLTYSVQAQRSLLFQSTINASRGRKIASWRQSLTFSNTGVYTDGANTQVNTQQTTGYDVSSSGYAKHFSYPLYAFSSYTTQADNFTIQATIDRGKDVQTLGQGVFPSGLESFSASNAVHSIIPTFQGASLSTTQNGNATYIANTTSSTSSSFGITEQDMTFFGITADSGAGPYGFPAISGSRELFERHVLAVNGTVVADTETLVGSPVGHQHGGPGSGRGFALSGLPGRGRKHSGLR
ncbi:hypothetical protein B0A48_11281 [Cryoendolithus antarcticus]|uniref:Peptide N-acetyl-beta-D-glucosaminyl asparaginase amidase A N-terminal domain-containing protein n=1 Tax=Cryoendolithus antarcticus TaxID=1507870 RepID=A0A1V8SUY4_9PEZI|nr:hypothetical protein B0A48_11281 [Cryoendolithus antarcticus]